MKVKDLMTKNVITFTPEMTIKEAMEILVKNNIGGAPVVENGKLVGIITQRDILSFLDMAYKRQGWIFIPTPFDIIEIPRLTALPYEKFTEIYESLGQEKIGNIMQKKVYFVEPDDDIEDAIQLLGKGKINRLPVVDQNRSVVGIITRGDILRGLSNLEKGKN
ncbi:MAG: HPP family protein [Thermoplasmata archaeon]|nr:CBS domain-containing protein [Thermoplasmata archaeon]